MSCIYGLHQFGNEDQGWLAHFIIAALRRQPLTIFGDGKQVRDVLYITDLLDLFTLVLSHKESLAGRVFNIGGGRENTISIWAELGGLLSRLIGRDLSVHYEDWRPGDQRVYYSDIRKVERALGWHPKVSVQEGVQRLLTWFKGQELGDYDRTDASRG